MPDGRLRATARGLAPQSVRRAYWRVSRRARRLAARLRKHPRFGRAVERLGAGEGAGPLPVRSGAYLPEEHALRVPLVLVVLLGLDRAAVAASVEDLAHLQVVQLSFRPVVVSTNADPVQLRRHGFVGELVMDPDEWARVGTGDEWERYVERRMARIHDDYQPVATLVGPVRAELTAPVLAGICQPRSA